MTKMKHLPLQNPHFLALLKQYHLHLETLGYNRHSLQALPSALREFFYYLEQQGVLDADKIIPQTISRYYKYLSLRPNQTRGGILSQYSLQRHLWALRCFFNYREADGSLKDNPLNVLHFPSPQHKIREVLTREEIHRLYEACERHLDRVLLGLLYGCGLRKSETEALNIKDISFLSALVYVRSGKGKKRRVIPMPPQVVGDLKNYYYQERIHIKNKNGPDPQKAFMLNTRGERMRGYIHWRRLKYLGRKAGIENSDKRVSPHILRHSIATHLLNQGVSIEQVRDFLGHSHLESTQRYTWVQEKGIHSISEYQ